MLGSLGSRSWRPPRRPQMARGSAQSRPPPAVSQLSARPVHQPPERLALARVDRVILTRLVRCSSGDPYSKLSGRQPLGGNRLERLAREAICLDVCPTSNVQLRVVG